MSSVNKAIILGNLGKDPEIRIMQNGKPVASFSIATSEKWKDQNGDKQERTQWHNVVVFNENLIDGVVRNYMKKGDKVFVEGQIETRKWTDKTGEDKYTTEIVLRPFRGEITLCGGAGKGPENKKEHRSLNEIPDDEIPF